MAEHFGAGQFLAPMEINTAVCVNTIPSPPLMEDFTGSCYAPKKAAETNIAKSAN